MDHLRASLLYLQAIAVDPNIMSSFVFEESLGTLRLFTFLQGDYSIFNRANLTRSLYIKHIARLPPSCRNVFRCELEIPDPARFALMLSSEAKVNSLKNFAVK